MGKSTTLKKESAPKKRKLPKGVQKGATQRSPKREKVGDAMAHTKLADSQDKAKWH